MAALSFSFRLLVSSNPSQPVILSMYSRRPLSVMSETECIANGPALPKGEGGPRSRCTSSGRGTGEISVGREAIKQADIKEQCLLRPPGLSCSMETSNASSFGRAVPPCGTTENLSSPKLRGFFASLRVCDFFKCARKPGTEKKRLKCLKKTHKSKKSQTLRMTDQGRTASAPGFLALVFALLGVSGTQRPVCFRRPENRQVLSFQQILRFVPT